MQKSPQAPTISVDGDSIQVDQAGTRLWELPIPKLKAIGEYTTDNGPFADDWFLVFVGNDEKWFEVQADAPTVSSALGKLSTQLQAPLELTLVRSTSFASTILWPRSLQGQDLLEFQKVTHRNWLMRTFGIPAIRMSLAKAVIDAVNEH